MDPVFSLGGAELVMRMPAQGIPDDWLARPLAELGLEASAAPRVLRVDAPASWRWSGTDAAFLAAVVRELGGSARAPEVRGVPPELQSLLEVSRDGATVAGTGPVQARPATLRGRAGAVALAAADGARRFVELLGEVVLLLPRAFALRARVRRADVWQMLAECGHRTLPIVAVVNVLMGGILAFVGAVELADFGAGIYVANLVGIASVRELTPILNAIVLAGRTGASFAATLATMQGNEEIDALTTFGIAPVEFLVLPRVLALSLLMPLTFVYGSVFALAGGMMVATPVLGLSAASYAVQTQGAIGGANFAIGALKALVFGAVVALIGCHQGLRASRSAAGVGAATTSAVVSSIIAVIALDAVFAVCAHALRI
ncbi:MAG: ABC transporter permease [Rhizobacter sp.]|nr:ABC transporter permease [Rhizobacter sp.]